MPTPLDRYRQFHGRGRPKVSATDFHYPKTLIYLGRVVAIAYDSDKKNGGGDGKPCIYEHEFETPVGLFMDERGKKQLYLLGPKMFVNEDGIQN